MAVSPRVPMALGLLVMAYRVKLWIECGGNDALATLPAYQNCKHLSESCL
jgi:hypothetical protein